MFHKQMYVLLIFWYSLHFSNCTTNSPLHTIWLHLMLGRREQDHSML